jgi:hypothetical protein
MSLYAWHFLRSINGVPTLGNGAGHAPAVGEWLEVAPPLDICHRGLHASWRAIDALGFVSWGSAIACLVEVDGIGGEHADKLVCSRRRIVAMVECDDVLRLFAREAALSVAQYWTMPPVVRKYLETGNEEIRAAAWAAAVAAARAAAVAAARDAAWVAAWADLNALLESLLLGAMDQEGAELP